MKKLKGKITILINSDYTEIRIEDSISSLPIATITLTPKQLSEALSRVASTPCEIEYWNNEKNLGKELQVDSFSVELTEEEYDDYENRVEIAKKKVNKQIPKGWVSDDYFNIQNSFYKKDEKYYAQTHIRNWK